MEALDYEASATLRVRSGNTVQCETGTLAEMVARAMRACGDPRCTLLLEVDDTTLGFGLIEAIYQRPDFPGRKTNEPGWVRDARQGSPRKPVSAKILARVEEATGLRLSRQEARPVVLLVEDEPLVRMLGVDLLSEAGFEVVEAQDSAEALAALESRPEIEILFTDVNMPGSLDGLALASLARDKRPDLKILVGSGVVRPGAGQLPTDTRFLSKPYRPAMVAETLREMLG